MQAGRFVREGPAREFVNTEALDQAYLGRTT